MKINVVKVIDVGHIDSQTSDPSIFGGNEKGEVKMKFNLLKVTDGRPLAGLAPLDFQTLTMEIVICDHSCSEIKIQYIPPPRRLFYSQIWRDQVYESPISLS